MSLGKLTFYQSGPNVTITELPPTLVSIGHSCFMACPNVSVNYFGGPDSALTSVGCQAFYGTAKNAANIAEIRIHKGVALEQDVIDPIEGLTGYGTFRGEGTFPGLQKIIIGFKHKYDNDSEFIYDLFGVVRTLEVQVEE
jgi:hypothetical protein